jgi:predicted ribosome quality control (RQC) complex YloA/Tae2 family protein
MGRLSNIILVDEEGLVMDAVKRVPASINRYRTVLPRHPYVPPPPQDKENPLLLTAARLGELWAEPADVPLWRRLVDTVRGISPLLAREIVYRALGTLDPEGEPGAAECQALAATLDELLHLPQTHAWAPSVGYEGEGDERAAVAYAPYALTHLLDYELVPGISAAMARVEGARAAGDPYRQARRRLNELIAEGLARQEARHASLARSLAPAADLERLQWSGNAILALGWSLAPGQTELAVEPGTFEGLDEPLLVAVDPALTPAENANRYFREYQRVKAATEQVPTLLSETEAELAFLRQLQAEAALARIVPNWKVEEELRRRGYGRGRRRRARAALAGTQRAAGGARRRRHDDLGGAQQPPERGIDFSAGRAGRHVASRPRRARRARHRALRRCAGGRGHAAVGRAPGGALFGGSRRAAGAGGFHRPAPCAPHARRSARHGQLYPREHVGGGP